MKEKQIVRLSPYSNKNKDMKFNQFTVNWCTMKINHFFGQNKIFYFQFQLLTVALQSAYRSLGRPHSLLLLFYCYTLYFQVFIKHCL